MVRYINIENGDVTVGITLTVPGCPLKDKIQEDVAKGVGLIPGVTSVKVDFDVMSDEQREQLKQKLGYTQPTGQEQPASILNYAKRFIAVSSGKGGGCGTGSGCL